MAAAEIDLGAIVRVCGESFLKSHRTTAAQRKAMRAIGACRTPALGGVRQQCDHCGHEHIQWHSCRNRACPRCQAAARRDWLEARSAELLSVPYFHVVFTVPEELNVLALHAPRVFYALLFRAVGATLTNVARTRLRAQIGALCVLHTWGQTLVLHPHIHCVIPGGGFSLDRMRWLGLRKPTCFLPVRVLSRRFGTHLCQSVNDAWCDGTLKIPTTVLTDSVALDLLLVRAKAKEWVVYAKAPFGGPSQVLGYLANYTHRIAISNSRIVSFDGTHVCLRYRDYANGNQQKILRLAVVEFIRRFLLHVVPSRFVRIRYYGFMANRVRTNNLARARELIGQKSIELPQPDPRPEEHRCPKCGEGIMRDAGIVVPEPISPRFEDSS